MTSLVNLVVYLGLTLGAWALGAIPPLTTAGVAFFVLAGVTNTLVGRWAWFQSMRALGPSRSTSLKATAPVFAALLALVLLGQRLAPNTLLGMVFVVGGVLLLHGDRSPSNSATGQPARAVQGVGLGLFSSFSYGCGTVLRAAGLGVVPSPFLGAFVGAVVASVSVLVSDLLRGN